MNLSDPGDFERRTDQLQLRARESLRADITALAGSDAHAIFRSPSDAAGYLVDGSPQLRCAALRALALHWQISHQSEYAPAVVEIARLEAVEEVRRDALSAAGLIYRGTDDVAVGVLLARAVADEHEEITTRKRAYVGLHSLRWKMPSSLVPFPSCIDWSLVSRFLDVSREAEPLDALGGIVRSLPMHVQAGHVGMARLLQLLESSEFGEAERLASGLLEQISDAPVLAVVYTYRARARMELGAIQGAIDDLSSAIQLDPNRASAFMLRSRAYGLIGNSGLADEDLRSATRILPSGGS